MPEWRNWQTRMVQVHVPARACRFKSCLRYFFGQMQMSLLRRCRSPIFDLQQIPQGLNALKVFSVAGDQD